MATNPTGDRNLKSDAHNALYVLRRNPTLTSFVELLDEYIRELEGPSVRGQPWLVQAARNEHARLVAAYENARDAFVEHAYKRRFGAPVYTRFGIDSPNGDREAELLRKMMVQKHLVETSLGSVAMEGVSIANRARPSDAAAGDGTVPESNRSPEKFDEQRHMLELLGKLRASGERGPVKVEHRTICGDRELHTIFESRPLAGADDGGYQRSSTCTSCGSALAWSGGAASMLMCAEHGVVDVDGRPLDFEIDQFKADVAVRTFGGGGFARRMTIAGARIPTGGAK